MSTSQIDGAMDSSVTSQAPVEATVVFSREPSVSRSTIDRPRERSTSRSRTFKVISVNKQVCISTRSRLVSRTVCRFDFPADEKIAV